MFLHSILVLFFVLLVAGVILWAITAIPNIDPTIKQYIRIAVYVVIALIFIFWLFGLFGIGPGLNLGGAALCRGRNC